MANVIRQVSYENRLTEDKGYGVADPVEDMFDVYNNEKISVLGDWTWWKGCRWRWLHH